MNLPQTYKYSEEHEWVKEDGNNVLTIGITDFAQNELGDIVFVELPAAGDEVKFGEPFGSVESVKTVSELYSPVDGKVIEVNKELDDSPEHVNSSPYEAGWMIKVEINDPEQLNKLWSAEKYEETYGD